MGAIGYLMTTDLFNRDKLKMGLRSRVESLFFLPLVPVVMLCVKNIKPYCFFIS